MNKENFMLQNDRFSLFKQREFRKCCEIAVLYVIFLATLLAITSPAGTKPTPSRKHTFKDFIEKYEPSTVWEQIDRDRINGANYTIEEETERFMEGIDPTDELLNLKVQNGNAKILVQRSGRRQMPPHTGTFSNVTDDPWNNRYRIVELMKQAIYQARNKMVIMQMLRAEHRNHSSYKMGYLVAKTDFATKTLAQFAWRAMRACTMKRQKRLEIDEVNYNFLEIIFTQERQMHLWFEVDLLIDLFWQNHLVAKKITNKRKIINEKKWNDGRFIN